MSLINIFWSDVCLMVFTPTLTFPLKEEGMKNLASNPSLPLVRRKARMGVKTLTSFSK
ncbi:MAG TPA: hypothetical protein VMW07_08160 [Gallionella sp.]|jgi:hypothetical protein|nr:hypothetical protein [Gallionella sp.]